MAAPSTVQIKALNAVRGLAALLHHCRPDVTLKP